MKAVKRVRRGWNLISTMWVIKKKNNAENEEMSRTTLMNGVS